MSEPQVGTGTSAGTSKLRVKIGSIEIEYEGPNDFVDQKLSALLKTLIEIRDAGEEEPEAEPSEETPAAPTKNQPLSHLSVTTIARKLVVSSNRDLMIAAALKLSFTAEKFSRKTLLNEMKTASGYYKAAYSNRMTQELQRACKAGQLNHVGGSDYSMPEEQQSALVAKLK